MTLKFKLIAGAVALSLVIGVAWAWVSAVERHARELAIAEEHEKVAQTLKEQNDARDKERQIEREQTAKLIEANQELSEKLAQSMVQRNRATDAALAQIRAAKTPEQVQKDAGKVLGVEPPIQADGSFKVNMAQLQECTACKVNEKRLEDNLADINKRLRLLEDNNERLTEQIARNDVALKEKDDIIKAQEVVIADYKKIAKRGKWRKFGSAVGKVGLAVIPAVAVGLIMR